MNYSTRKNLYAAVARFEGLTAAAPRLENAASRVDARCYALFADGRPDDIGALLAEDHVNEDRRQGLRRETTGRAAAIENIRAIAASDVNITNTPLALRGNRLCLSHILFERREAESDRFRVETLELAEIDADGLMAAKVVFDVDDMDSAIAELDARYLADEGAPHARTWAVVAEAYAAANRNELAPTTADMASIDHRRLAMIESGGLVPYIRDTFSELANLTTYLEAVHRLTDLGAVVTHVGAGNLEGGV